MPEFMNLFSIISGSSGTTPTAPSYSDWQSIITAVTSTFSIASIVAVLAAVVGSGIVFVFLWWGVRLSFRSIMGAVKNGTLSINAKKGGRRRG